VPKIFVNGQFYRKCGHMFFWNTVYTALLCGYYVIKHFDATFSRFDRLHESDGQTDGESEFARGKKILKPTSVL